MSKLYPKYVSLKKEDSSKVYLFKSGIFYLFLDEDAKLMAPLLQLKLTNLNPDILKCGFPVSSLEKYLPLLKQTGKIVELINLEKNLSLSPKQFLITEEVKSFIHYLATQDSNTFSIKEAYQFIDEVVSKSKQILKEELTDE